MIIFQIIKIRKKIFKNCTVAYKSYNTEYTATSSNNGAIKTRSVCEPNRFASSRHLFTSSVLQFFTSSASNTKEKKARKKWTVNNIVKQMLWLSLKWVSSYTRASQRPFMPEHKNLWQIFTIAFRLRKLFGFGAAACEPSVRHLKRCLEMRWWFMILLHDKWRERQLVCGGQAGEQVRSNQLT